MSTRFSNRRRLLLGYAAGVGIDRTQGRAFEDRAVALAYAHRPPYAPELYALLGSLVARSERALDLGCGPGKLTRELAKTFAWVDAVDPSREMLEIARRSDLANVDWILASAEQAPLAPRYDLVTAGASIHWMEHARLFPRLARHLADDGFVAIVDGDGAHDPPWEPEWEAFMVRWLDSLGRDYQPSSHAADMSAFEQWLDVCGREAVTVMHEQSIESFIECQHSRATFSRATMPKSGEFDEELHALLEPYGDRGQLHYAVRTRLVWGKPRSEP